MVELLLWGCKELKKNFVFIPIIFVLALVLSFMFSEKDPSKTEKAIQPVNEKFELTEKEKNKILLDIRKACSKLINLVSSKDTTTETMITFYLIILMNPSLLLSKNKF